ncbi:hypothetical protein [Oceanobacillus halotolerans]|uniref:hypothetical protein n=1 Tax=Oceanobacillus halotolerans TaxID=2663380 RepID=UPI0013D23E1C|nr:hypothetical protein [Oceanobacillus halotolerans]
MKQHYIIIVALLSLMVSCSSNDETEDRTYTAESDHWYGEINLKIYDPSESISESAHLSLYYNGSSTGSFNYLVRPE